MTAMELPIQPASCAGQNCCLMLPIALIGTPKGGLDHATDGIEREPKL
jgi:hypothetical protein